MPQSLPDRPNLEHLRKQAKTLLPELERADPNARLADALHAVARRYGFASWPKLKAQVEALAPHNPFVGRWIADIARSVRHPANPFQKATIDLAVVGNVVTISHGFVDEAGGRHHDRTTLDVDGVERMTPNGYAMTARWVGARAFETVARQNGIIVGSGRYEVSADDDTLTISAPEQRIVLVRE